MKPDEAPSRIPRARRETLRATLALAPILLATVGANDVSAQIASQLADRADSAVVTLKVHDASGTMLGQGSGFFLSDGRIVTNTHVVEGAARVDVFGMEERFLGSVPHAEALSSAVDLAILPRLGSIPGSLELASAPPTRGEPVVVIGAPLGLSHTLSDGIVSAVRRVDGTELVQLTAPISPGSSGGPVLNENGEVVGVAVAIIEEGQAINFAVPAREVIALAASPGGSVPFPGRSAGAPAENAVRSGSPSLRSIRIGESVEGTLSTSDETWEGGYVHLYALEATEGEVITISLSSDAFDAYVALASADAEWGQVDDDGGIGLDAELTVTIPSSDTYYVVATSYGDAQSGEYQLAVARAPQNDAPQSQSWVQYKSTGDPLAFYRPESLRETSPGIYEVWQRWEYNELQEGARQGEEYDVSLVLVRINCGSWRMQPRSWVYYRDGISVSSRDLSFPEWSPLIPDSVGEALAELVCGG